MKSKKVWILSLSIATVIAANGIVMAAANSNQKENSSGKRQESVAKYNYDKRGEMKGFHRDNTALLEFLKLDAQTFEAAIKDGKTLVDIAKEQGISEKKLKAFLVEQMTNRIDMDIKAGKLPENKTAQLRADIEKRVSDMINGKAPNHGPRGHAPFNNAKLLELLKMDEKSFRDETKAGKSLVTIAKERGISEQAVKKLIIQQMNERIDQDVQAGRIPNDKTNQMKADLEKHASNILNGYGPQKDHRPMGHSPFVSEKLLDLLKMDEESLKSEMKLGKSLVNIAKEQGVSEKALKDLLAQEMSQRINAGVAAGKIPSDKAEKIKSDMEKRILDMINGQAPMHNREHKLIK